MPGGAQCVPNTANLVISYLIYNFSSSIVISHAKKNFLTKLTNWACPGGPVVAGYSLFNTQLFLGLLNAQLVMLNGHASAHFCPPTTPKIQGLLLPMPLLFLMGNTRAAWGQEDYLKTQLIGLIHKLEKSF